LNEKEKKRIISVVIKRTHKELNFRERIKPTTVSMNLKGV